MALLEPASVEELSVILRDANAAKRPLIPVGGRSGIGAIPTSAASASILSTGALPRAIDHVAGDLVATIPAGVSLADANAALAREGQRLPLDPPFAARATIGGIVAANESGPRRHHFGAPRDLIIGINVALADGRLAKAGGKVVKNVAGYDLSRLMCGSLGCLAVISSATFKLSPVAASSQTVAADIERRERVSDLLQALARAPLTPSALELVAPPARLLIRFETTEASAAHMANQAIAICGQHDTPASIVSGAPEGDLWQAAERNVWAAGGTRLKIAVLPTDVAYLLDHIETSCAASGVAFHLTGRAALGVLSVRLEGDAAALIPLIADWRHRAAVNGGSLVVQAAQPGLERVDPWGDLPDAFPLMRAVKARFDPNGILSPGMGPGGL